MNASRLACAAGAATVVLLSGCDPGTASGSLPARGAGGTLVATEDTRGARADPGDGLERGAPAGFGIRPTGATANGITP